MCKKYHKRVISNCVFESCVLTRRGLPQVASSAPPQSQDQVNTNVSFRGSSRVSLSTCVWFQQRFRIQFRIIIIFTMISGGGHHQYLYLGEALWTARCPVDEARLTSIPSPAPPLSPSSIMLSLDNNLIVYG